MSVGLIDAIATTKIYIAHGLLDGTSKYDRMQLKICGNPWRYVKIVTIVSDLRGRTQRAEIFARVSSDSANSVNLVGTNDGICLASRDRLAHLGKLFHNICSFSIYQSATAVSCRRI